MPRPRTKCASGSRPSGRAETAETGRLSSVFRSPEPGSRSLLHKVGDCPALSDARKASTELADVRSAPRGLELLADLQRLNRHLAGFLGFALVKVCVGENH